jgi:peroxiredoxin
MRWLLLLALVSVCFAANEFSNRRAPGFCLPDSAIQRHDLQDFRGKWVLIDFMETSCPHCQELSRTLEKLKTRFGDRVVILSVVIAPPETQQSVADYIRAQKITIPILFDQGQMAASYFQATPAKPSFDTPHLFIIDPTGTIVRDFSHPEASALTKELDVLVK